jgi:hypothetical protein
MRSQIPTAVRITELLLFGPEDRGSIILRNAGIYLRVQTALQHRTISLHDYNFSSLACLLCTSKHFKGKLLALHVIFRTTF